MLHKQFKSKHPEPQRPSSVDTEKTKKAQEHKNMQWNVKPLPLKLTMESPWKKIYKATQNVTHSLAHSIAPMRAG